MADRWDALTREEARELLTSSRGHRSRAIRRFPPSKKVLNERRPPAPWILLTKDPEPSPAPPEEGRSEKASRSERRGGEAQHWAAALLAPTTPTPTPAPEAVEEMEVRDA